MEHSQNSAGLQGTPVTVVLDKRESVRQPGNFRVCPLGIQLYSPRKLPEYEILEFAIDIPRTKGNRKENIKCTGVVVRCAKDSEPSLYRVWVKFLDLPKAKRNRLQCLSKTGRFQCPYCENF